MDAARTSAPRKRRGLFVVVEGPDGSGKTSVVQQLAVRFRDACVTREPGGAPFSEVLRECMFHAPGAHEADGLTHLLLHYAARREHLRATIIPALEEGKLVISDRFAASSWAYNVRGQACAECVTLFPLLHKAVVGAYEPDAYIWLELSPSEAQERRKQEGHANYFDAKEDAFHRRVYDAYHEYFAQHYTGEVVRIAAHQPLEQVVQEAARWIAARLEERVQGE